MTAESYINTAAKFYGISAEENKRRPITLDMLRNGLFGTFIKAGYSLREIGKMFAVSPQTVKASKDKLLKAGLLALFLCCSLVQAQELKALTPKVQAITAPRYIGNTLAFTWTRSPDTNVVGYRFYYGTNYALPNSTATVGNVTNATLDQLTAGVDYYFRIVAYDAIGVESKFSNTVTNYIFPRLEIAPYVYAIRTFAPNRTNLWQVSTNGSTWTTLATIVTNAGAALMLARTNNGAMELVRLK